MRIDLTEGMPGAEVRLRPDQARALAATRWVDVTPAWGDEWSLRARSCVGTATVGDLTLSITPKLPIRRIFFLIGYATNEKHWQASDTAYGGDTGLLPVMASAYARQLDRALGQGVLQGYHHVEESLPLVRGRVRAADQLRRRHGIPLPVEVAYDEFDTDTAENQILRHAASLLLQVRGISADARRRLIHAQARLADVTVLRRGVPLPSWRPTRLNGRYHVALRLAELIAASVSIDRTVGDVRASGFMVDLAGVFESFLTTALSAAWAASVGGRVRAQDRWHLDEGRSIVLKPDIVWYPPGSASPGVVVDAKYKAEKPSGLPNADVYQMMAYCSRLGLDVGHLVYAAGSAEPRRHHLPGGLTVVHHVLDLDVEPVDLLTSVERLALRTAGPTAGEWRATAALAGGGASSR